jgi:hypothetical protein
MGQHLNKIKAKSHPQHYLLHRYWGRKAHNVVSEYIKNYSKKNLCPNAEYLQPRILQFKTNYWKIEDMHKQARVLEKTLKFFGKQF